MDRKAPQHAFPTVTVVSTLTAAAAVTGAVAFAIAAWTVDPATARSAVLFAVIVVWLASVLAIAPVALLGRRGVTPTIAAYFVGMAGRLLVCLAAALVAVMLLKLPAAPTLLSMVAAYLVLLLVEVTFVGRYLLGMDARIEPVDDAKAAAGTGPEVTA